MKIHEIEIRTGMEPSEIYFYIRERLTSQIIGNIEDHEFSDCDLETLLRIKLLRGIRIPYSEIKALIYGEISLTEVLDHQIHVLQHGETGFDVQEVGKIMNGEETSILVFTRRSI